MSFGQALAMPPGAGVPEVPVMVAIKVTAWLRAAVFPGVDEEITVAVDVVTHDVVVVARNPVGCKYSCSD